MASGRQSRAACRAADGRFRPRKAEMPQQRSGQFRFFERAQHPDAVDARRVAFLRDRQKLVARPPLKE